MTRQSVEIIQAVFAWAGAAYSVYGLTQLMMFLYNGNGNVNFNAWDVVPRVPYFSSENVHAAYSVIAILFSFSMFLRVKTVTSFVLLILNLGGLLATGTRGAMITLIPALIMSSTYFFHKDRSSRIYIAVSVATCCFFVAALWDTLFLRFNFLLEGGDGTSRVRFDHFLEMYELFLERPILGIGLGGSLKLSAHDIHNLFLMVLFEAGLVSFSVFMLFFLWIYFINFFWKSTRPGLRGVGVLGVSFAVIGQASMEPALFFFHIYFVFALLLYSGRNERVGYVF